MSEELPRIRPKQGQVLVEVLAPPLRNGGIFLPGNHAEKDSIGRMPGRMGLVLSVGVWPTNKRGRPYPYDFRIGDTVMVDPVLGHELRAYPRHLRLYDHTEILAKVEEQKPVCDHVYETLPDGRRMCFECDHIESEKDHARKKQKAVEVDGSKQARSAAQVAE